MRRLKAPIIFAASMLLLHMTGFASNLSHDLLGLRFALLERAPSREIAIVAIDAPSIEAIGVWPWPRSLHAQLIDTLRAAEASEIVFDVEFGSASSPEQDQAFEDALKRADGSVALPTFKQIALQGERKAIFNSEPLPRFASQAWSVGVNVEPDVDGVIRHYRVGHIINGRLAPSLATMVAGHASVAEDTFLIDFGIRSADVPTFSFVDILKKPELSSLLAGKKVIIGATAVELGDRVNVPGGRIIPGVTLQALAAESLRQGRAIEALPIWLSYLMAAAAGLLVLFLRNRQPTSVLMVMLVAVACVAEMIAFGWQWRSPVFFDTIPLHLAVLCCVVLITVDEVVVRGLLRRAAEKRFHRVAMSIADGLICTDAHGRITMWNRAAEAMFNRAAPEAIGLHVSTVLKQSGDRDWTPELLGAELTLTGGGTTYGLQGIRSDGVAFAAEASISSWENGAELNYSVAVRDVSVRKREEQRIRFLADHDVLTGLLNRRSLIEQLQAFVEIAASEKSEVALLLVDLDRFKEINDTLGHAGGDHVLCEAAHRIHRAVAAQGVVARLGGDEFAIVISGEASATIAERLGAEVIECLQREPFLVLGTAQSIAASVGVAIYPRNSGDSQELIGNADLAMYRAKLVGGRHLAVFEQSMREEFESRITLTEELSRALTQGEFEMYYQPQVDLRSGRTVGAEALIRWNHPLRGMVAPADFIPLLNTLPMSNDVSFWIMRTACQQARRWQAQGHEIRISINLSPAQFRTMDLPRVTASVLAVTGLPAHLLELEVTENIVIEDDASALETFRRLSELGVHLAWDDFGTGYGSLTYLKKFPLNRLKIDQTFVRTLKAGTQDFAIVEYTVRLSKVLGLAVTAEGIETAEVLDLLANMGCEEGQGYYFSRPLPAPDFTRQCLTELAETAA